MYLRRDQLLGFSLLCSAPILVCVRHIVTNGGSWHTHRNAKFPLVELGPIQLQQRLKGLVKVAVI